MRIALPAISPLVWFIGLWTVFNLVQGAFLLLDPDEAYYYMYAQQLDWGYFDHPPVTALLVRFGISWLPGTLGVRLGHILLHAGTLFFFWKLVGSPTDSRRFGTWAILAASLPFLQVYGWIATPDGPLLFFSVLYLFLLNRFLERPSWRLALIWGAVMAALLYSKYHGILVILLTVSVQGKLWRDPRFWVAGIWGALLFLPHLWWQYIHDFPSFRYHLKGRDDLYRAEFTYMYVINQLVVFGPLLIPLFLRALFAPVEGRRIILALTLGFWAFFFYTTFKGHVEPQWTAVLSFPLVWAAFSFSAAHPGYELWLRRLGMISIVLMVALRLALFIPIPGLKNPFLDKRWPEELAALADGAPIVFQNSYRDVSEYCFYTGQPGYTFTNVFYRPNQFDIWDSEKALQNQRVLMILQMGQNPCTGCDTLRLSGKTRQAIWADSLQVAQKVRLDMPQHPARLIAGQVTPLSLTLNNPYPHDLYPGRGSMPVRLYAAFIRDEEVVHYAEIILRDAPSLWPSGKQLALEGTFEAPALPEGKYELVLGVGNGEMPPGYNSKKWVVVMAKP